MSCTGPGKLDGMHGVQVQVEGSGRWPDDDEAAGKLRAALGCQIAQALESQFGLSVRAAESFVDVHVQGFALRLQVWSSRDDALADRAKMVSSLLSSSTTERYNRSRTQL